MTSARPRFALAALGVALALGAPAVASADTTITVNSTADAPLSQAPCSGGSADCTLRAALQQASSLSGNVTVQVPAGTYALTVPQTSPRTSVDDGSVGNLVIQNPDTGVQRTVTVAGAGAGATVIDGGARLVSGAWTAGDGDRVLQINGTLGGLTVAVSGVTITGGNATSVTGCGTPYGGGILVIGAATMTIDDSAIIANAAQSGDGIGGGGGGIGVEPTFACAAAKALQPAAAANVTVTDSTIADNYSGGNGGGFAGSGSGTYDFSGDTFTTNVGQTGGGAYYGTATGAPLPTAARAATVGQTSGAADVATFLNDTITANSATGAGEVTADGGGIELASAVDGPTATLEHVTINANGADGAGGNISSVGGTVTVGDSIVAQGSDTATPVGTVTPLVATSANCDFDVASSIVSAGGNLFDNDGSDCNASSSDITNPSVGVGLLPLSDNGGPTETEAIVPTSPAVAAADASRCPTVAVDQRGDARAAHCDVGAYELVAADASVPLVATTTTATTTTSAAVPAPAVGVRAAAITVRPLLPVVKACTSRRDFIIHIQHVAELHVVSATIYVDGHRELFIRSHLAGPVDLRHLPYGTFVVRIDAHTASGATITGRRTYHTCRGHRLPGHRFLKL